MSAAADGLAATATGATAGAESSPFTGSAGPASMLSALSSSIRPLSLSYTVVGLDGFLLAFVRAESGTFRESLPVFAPPRGVSSVLPLPRGVCPVCFLPAVLLTAPVSMLGVALGIAFLLSSFFTLVSLLATAGGIAARRAS